MASAYDRSKHYLLCSRCRGPVEVGWEVATATCSHCQAPLQVRVRSRAAAAPRPARSEAERRALLGDQDRRFAPPSELAPLFIGERIAASLEEQAMARWQQARGQIQGENAAPSLAVDFFVLTLGLSELRFERGDFLGQRAIVDSAIDLLPAEEHAQVLQAQLARSALRAGDQEMAESWLSACNPSSETLLADTAYRFARAYVDTARGDMGAVVRTLGSGDVPLSEAYAAEAAVLCANAWEQLGQLALAVDILVAGKRELGPITAGRVARFAASHRAWNLCPRSGHIAEERAAENALPMAGYALAGLILMSMGLTGLLWAGVALWLFLADRLDVWMMIMNVVPGALVGALLGPIGVASFSSARAKSRQRSEGSARAARILARKIVRRGPLQSTIELSLLIVPDDAPAYQSTIETGVLTDMLDNFRPGQVLDARIGSSPHDYTLDVL
ncbi:MAG: hypothetical protein KJO07_03805 [Deltaproteobacteria bacterium]|nr:hypothetical protein [Deltaproteobacteria bacterium]